MVVKWMGMGMVNSSPTIPLKETIISDITIDKTEAFG
jgi:hypothetical protein